jgi:DNA mismatch repair protein MutS2
MVQGLVLDRSGSGATAFIEPFAAVSLNNAYMEADAEYKEAVITFLRGLLDSLRSKAEDFMRWREFLADADETIALLQWARLCDGALPKLGADGLARLCAHHPLLLPKVRSALGLDGIGHEVVPLDLALGVDMPCLVISGSNTGGKTVTLKTVGLLATLANCGCAIPAKPGTEFPPMASLHADIGDHQTLIGSLSTFSSHIMHLKIILGQARRNGLVLLDELGTGTDPREGAALGIAILDALSSRGSWVLCSTHLGEISQWALKHPRFQNASVQFDEDLLAPTYRLLMGQPGQSRAITIAEKLGLPKPILALARKKLGRREQDWREFLRQLEAERSRLLQESDELAKAKAAVEKDMRILADREAQLMGRQEKFKEESSAKLARVLEFADAESKRLVKEMKAQQKESRKDKGPPVNPDRAGTEAKERVKVIEDIAHMELASLMPKTKPIDPKAIVVGMYAKHRGLGIKGRIASIKGKKAILETAPGRSLEAPLDGLEPLDRRMPTMDTLGGRTRVRADYSDIEGELNLIGRASDDIDLEVHRFIESALASGNRFIRIVHGHGTGRLKKAVWEALHGHPGISCVEDAPQAQGGAGATLVSLK